MLEFGFNFSLNRTGLNGMGVLKRFVLFGFGSIYMVQFTSVWFQGKETKPGPLLLTEYIVKYAVPHRQSKKHAIFID